MTLNHHGLLLRISQSNLTLGADKARRLFFEILADENASVPIFLKDLLQQHLQDLARHVQSLVHKRELQEQHPPLLEITEIRR